MRFNYKNAFSTSSNYIKNLNFLSSLLFFNKSINNVIMIKKIINKLSIKVYKV